MSFDDEIPQNAREQFKKPKCTCSTGSCSIHKAETIKTECICKNSRHPSCPTHK